MSGGVGAEQRLAKLAPDSLDPEQRAVYDAVAGGPRAQGPQLFELVDADGGLQGPFNAFLLQPRLGGPLQEVGSAVRYATSLTDRARELAILVVAVHADSAFEWYAHEAVGRHVGLTPAELDGVRRLDWEGFEGVERAVVSTTHLLVTTGDLDDASFAEAVDLLGRAQLFELTTLVGYYSLLALQLRVFRVESPGG